MGKLGMVVMVLATAVACTEAPETESIGEQHFAAEVAVRPWSSRDPRVRLWPADTRNPVVIVTRGHRTLWRAVGVDADRDVILWAYEGDSTNYAHMVQVNSVEWMNASMGGANIGSKIAGWIGPGNPNPPSPNIPEAAVAAYVTAAGMISDSANQAEQLIEESY